MKRCPECQFLYDDHQDHCDLDGTLLLFTATLTALPKEVAPIKSLWGGFTIPLLAVLVLTTVLLVLSRVEPGILNWTVDASSQPASQSVPDPAKDPQPAKPNVSEPPASAPADPPASAKPSADPSKVKTRKVDGPMAETIQKPAAPVSHVQVEANTPPIPLKVESKPPAQAKSSSVTAPMNPKPPSGSYSIASHPKPPVAAATATPQPKDSKFNSFLKKTGRIFKKPF